MAVCSSSTSYTAVLSILITDWVDNRHRDGHGCASGRRDRDEVRPWTTTANRSGLRGVVGVRNRVGTGTATTDRRVLGRYVGVDNRVRTRTGSTTTERSSSYGRRIRVGNRIGSGTSTAMNGRVRT